MEIKEWDFNDAPDITKPCLDGRQKGDKSPIKCAVNDGKSCFWENICGKGLAFDPNFDKSKLPLRRALG